MITDVYGSCHNGRFRGGNCRLTEKSAYKENSPCCERRVKLEWLIDLFGLLISGIYLLLLVMFGNFGKMEIHT